MSLILVIIYSCNGLPPVWLQAIYRSNTDLLSSVLLETINSELKYNENLSRKRIWKCPKRNCELEH